MHRLSYPEDADGFSRNPRFLPTIISKRSQAFGYYRFRRNESNLN